MSPASNSGGRPPKEKNPWLRVPWWLYVLAAVVVIVVVSELTSPQPASEPGPSVTVTETETEVTTEPPATVTETETIEAPAAADDEDEPIAPDQETAEPEAPAESADTYVYYDNCDEARAAGDAPLFVGDPGYGSHLDRDGDGVACEPYAGP